MTKRWNYMERQAMKDVTKITNKLPPEARRQLFRQIANDLSNKAAEMMFHFTPKVLDKTAYRWFVPEEIADLMVAASRQMPLTHYVDNVKAYNELTPVSFSMVYGSRGVHRVQWLWPQKINHIEHDHPLIDIVDMAIQWQTTIKLLELFGSANLPRSLIVYMLPWLRLILAEYRGSFSKFDKEIELLLSAGKPSFIPGCASQFTSMCRYGGELLTAYTLIKDVKPPVLNYNMVGMVPVLDDNLVEDECKDMFEEFMRNWRTVKTKPVVLGEGEDPCENNGTDCGPRMK